MVFGKYKKMEAWVGIEPTRHGFANRSLSHSSTTPWLSGNIPAFSGKTSPDYQKILFFSAFSVFSAVHPPVPARNRIDKDYILLYIAAVEED